MQLTFTALLAALLLVGCSEPKKYIISYEVMTKSGTTIRGTTVQPMPKLTEARLAIVLSKVFDNPSVLTNGVVILAVIPLEQEGW